jgi:hypothetical protein
MHEAGARVEVPILEAESMICYDRFVSLKHFSSIFLFDRDRDPCLVVTSFIGLAIFMICRLREEILENESLFDDLFVIIGKRDRLSGL